MACTVGWSSPLSAGNRPKGSATESSASTPGPTSMPSGASWALGFTPLPSGPKKIPPTSRHAASTPSVDESTTTASAVRPSHGGRALSVAA